MPRRGVFTARFFLPTHELLCSARLQSDGSGARSLPCSPSDGSGEKCIHALPKSLLTQEGLAVFSPPMSCCAVLGYKVMGRGRDRFHVLPVMGLVRNVFTPSLNPSLRRRNPLFSPPMSCCAVLRDKVSDRGRCRYYMRVVMGRG